MTSNPGRVQRLDRSTSLLPIQFYAILPARNRSNLHLSRSKYLCIQSLKMQQFAATCEAVAATTTKTEKARSVAEYFRSRPMAEAAQAAIFLSGRAFPAWTARTLQPGGTLLWRAVAELS